MKMNWANRITILRIFLIIPFVMCMFKMNDPSANGMGGNVFRYIGIVIFILMAVSDGVDGYLARSRGQETRLGAFLDPTADKLLMTAAAILLASTQTGVKGFLLPAEVVILIIGKDMLLLIGFLIVYFITSQVRIVPGWTGKTGTVLQLTMIAAILLSPEISGFVPHWIWVLRALWCSASATAVLATLVYIRQGIRYIEEYEQNINNGKNKQ